MVGICKFLVSLIARLPFPNVIIRMIRWIAKRMLSTHRYALYTTGMVLALISARIVTRCFQIPTKIFWQTFGSLSGNDVATLAWYGRLATIVSFLVATRVAYEAYVPLFTDNNSTQLNAATERSSLPKS